MFKKLILYYSLDYYDGVYHDRSLCIYELLAQTTTMDITHDQTLILTPGYHKVHLQVVCNP